MTFPFFFTVENVLDFSSWLFFMNSSLNEINSFNYFISLYNFYVYKLNLLTLLFNESFDLI